MIIMEREVLQAVVQNAGKEDIVQKVITVTEDSAVGPGDNFTSTVLKLRAKVLLGSGRLVNRTYILKKLPPFKGQEELFQSEIKIYINVLKEMDYLIEEFGDTEEPLWCQLIYYEPYTSLLLEDLQGRGYKMVNRRVGLDLDHGMLAIRDLGRFHGLAKILEERGIISKEDYRPYHGKAKEVVQGITYSAVRNMIGGIRKWGLDWNDIATNLDLSVEEFYQNVCKSVEVKESDFKVLNHGDCWCNNIMFKYDWRNKPISVRFIDFQTPHHSTPLMDVSHFLYFSMQPSIRRKNYHSLLENYHRSLILTLTKYGYQGSIPSMDDLVRIMNQVSYFWIYIYASWYPLVIAEPKETPDLSIIVQTQGKEGFRTEIYEEDGVKELLALDLLDLYQKKHNFPSL